MRKGVLFVVYINVSRGQNMVSHFCKRFGLYNGADMKYYC